MIQILDTAHWELVGVDTLTCRSHLEKVTTSRVGLILARKASISVSGVEGLGLDLQRFVLLPG